MTTDAATLQRIDHGLAELQAPSPNTGCTSEICSTMFFIATAGTRTARIWVENYGCGYVTDGTDLLIGGKSLAWATMAGEHRRDQRVQ